MSLTTILTQIIGPVIRPIIREELAEFKDFIVRGTKRLKKYEEIEKESDELIKLAANASTTEEVKAHLRKLRATRATLND